MGKNNQRFAHDIFTCIFLNQDIEYFAEAGHKPWPELLVTKCITRGLRY